MGAWNYGIFDDDTAYDFFDEIEENAYDFFKTSFEEAIGSEYLEYDECHMVTVSGAYIDNVLNGTHYRTDHGDDAGITNVNNFQCLYQGNNLEELKAVAVKALQIVVGDNSELNELWSENKELYPKWKGNLLKLIERLK